MENHKPNVTIWTRFLSLLAYISTGASILGLAVGLLGVVLSFLMPSIPIKSLYIVFRSPNAMGFSCVLVVLCYVGACQFLLSRAKTVSKAFNSHPSKLGRRVGIIGLVLLGLMFVAGFQYVLYEKGKWEFDSKAGSIAVSETQARQQLWRNLRWESLLLLNVVNLVGTTAFDLLRVIRSSRANEI